MLIKLSLGRKCERRDPLSKTTIDSVVKMKFLFGGSEHFVAMAFFSLV